MTGFILTVLARLLFVGIVVLIVVLFLASRKSEKDTYERHKEHSRKTGRW